MKRGAKLLVKGYDGIPRGPFRWTSVREWVSVGYFSPADEVRLPEDTAWSPIVEMPELLAAPQATGTDGAQSAAHAANDRFQARIREKKAVGPRATAYLGVLGCPVRPQRLNPYTALEWIKILEEHSPHLANATERWAAEEESNDRIPAASPGDATAEQLEKLRSLGRSVPAGLSRLEARRLIAGPPTEEQRRRLEFYGIPLPPGSCQEEAAELIDRYMREHWEAEEAYQAHRIGLAAEESARKGSPNTPAPKEPAGPAKAETRPPPSDPRLKPVPAPAIPSSGGRPTRPQARLALAIAGLIVAGMIVAKITLFRRQPGPEQADANPVATKPPESGSSGAGSQSAGNAKAGAGPASRKAGPGLEAFVMTLKLAGIFGGPEPRALIDDRTYRVGDVIDQQRGIFVVDVNPTKLSVVFGDREGNLFERFLK